MAETIHLGTLEYQEAKRIQSLLEERGVKLELAVQPESCGKGCKPVADVFVDEEKLPVVRELLTAEREKGFAGLEFDSTLVDQVFDTEKEDAVCPACGTAFKTTARECPDCGLVFVTE
ncbi:MAG TPA: hypothetical protein VM598_12820 [Bdellovibrionota bacterium]|jgi:hypothetical protein|nr:hypothetical protein [Bdellovibrionota bacterium]